MSQKARVQKRVEYGAWTITLTECQGAWAAFITNEAMGVRRVRASNWVDSEHAALVEARAEIDHEMADQPS